MKEPCQVPEKEAVLERRYVEESGNGWGVGVRDRERQEENTPRRWERCVQHCWAKRMTRA